LITIKFEALYTELKHKIRLIQSWRQTAVTGTVRKWDLDIWQTEHGTCQFVLYFNQLKGKFTLKLIFDVF